jgi:pimeloyl-ACP methyl ester carboxylesterase
MSKHYKRLVATFYLSFALYGCATTTGWKANEMSSRRGSHVEADLKPGSSSCGFGLSCKFELHYFEGLRNNPDVRPKMVLYIPGGPGEIVDRETPALDYADFNANYLYFDVRGTGYSLLPESNDYDQFLRAQNVVEDIEELRKKYFVDCSEREVSVKTGCERKSKAWDAIYAHSWGTIVAQMYARKYPQSVKALILSAPVARASADTGTARRKMIVDNLMDIYKKHRNPKTGNCSWPPDAEVIVSLGKKRHPLTDNFCFLQEDSLNLIRGNLESLLSGLEHSYGSSAFVNHFYDTLVKDEEFRSKYPYREEFFKALRWLEWLGAGEDEGFHFLRNVRQSKIDAALFLGYYLTEPKPVFMNESGKKAPFNCSMTSPFLELISDRPIIKTIFCARIKAAADALEYESPTDDSLRASSVFGVFDGVARWIFGILEKEQRTDDNRCFKAQDLRDIATGKLLPDNKPIQEIVRKIGMAGIRSDEKVCPWDPSHYRHEVPTLLLSGCADPVTAGGQARYFYETGLTPGRRALIEFSGVGHGMSSQLKVGKPQDSEEEFAQFVQKFASPLAIFLDTSNNVDDFVKNDKLKGFLAELRAHLWPEDGKECAGDRS